MIEVSNLVKTYPGSTRPTLDRLSFAVGKGEIFGFLGRNGAGKTMTINVMATLLPKTSGEAAWVAMISPRILLRPTGW